MSPRITTVFFDFGGTLADLPAERVVLLRDDLKRIGFDVPRDEAARALESAGKWREENRAPFFPNYAERTNHFVSYCLAIIDALGLPGDRAQIAGRLWDVWDTAPEVWTLYPDVRPCIETLAGRGVRLGIISNWDKLNLPATCDQISIARYFAVILSSAEANADKPDPAIFHTALARMGSAPAESAHVGDSMGADVEGAMGVGMSAVWIARGTDPPAAPCPVISTLAELPGVLGLGE